MFFIDDARADLPGPDGITRTYHFDPEKFEEYSESEGSVAEPFTLQKMAPFMFVVLGVSLLVMAYFHRKRTINKSKPIAKKTNRPKKKIK